MADDGQARAVLLADAQEALARVAPVDGPPAVDVAVQRSAAAVVQECRDVQETVDSVGGALQVFVAPESGWGDYGLVGLPAAAAMKVVSSVASQYLQKSTGMSLGSWIDFVHDCSGRFASYVAQLESTAAPQEIDGDAGTEHGAAARRERVEALTSLRRETAAWKAVLGTVEDLGTVVEAVRVAVAGTPAADTETPDHTLDAAVDAVPSPAARPRPEPPGEATDRPGDGTSNDPSGAMGRFTRRAVARTRHVGTLVVQQGGDILDDAKPRVSALGQRIRPSATNMVHWATRPLLDLTEQVGALPSDVAELGEEATLLEVLLDLNVASLLVELGELSDSDARLVDLRIAALVWLPGLSEALREANLSLSDYQRRVRRVDELSADGRVGERARTLLLQEYAAGVATARSRVDQLDRIAASWREDGAVVIGACDRWVSDEVDLLQAREHAEGATADSGDRLALLRRERARLASAGEALRTL